MPYIVAFVVAGGAAAYFWMNSSPEAVLADRWSMVGKYCIDCHNNADYTAELSFEGLHAADVTTHADIFEKAIHKLRTGAMPPRDEPQPPTDVREQFVSALEGTLDDAARADPYASTTKVHRLNRAEYANVVRDLLGVEADVADLLPSDGGDFGFDNIAEVLTTSPMLLERYLTVALRVADLAVGDPEAIPTVTTYGIPIDTTQNGHMEGLPLGTRGGIKIRHTFPADAEYVFSGRLIRGVEEGYFGVEGHDRPHEFLVLVDGEVVYSNEIGGKEDHEASLELGINEGQLAVDDKLTSPPIPIAAGPHDVTFTWKERPAIDQSVWERVDRASLEIHNPSGMPRLEVVRIEGPRNVTGVSETPTRDKIFVCEPETAAEEPACAQKIFLTLARRAFRRPVDADDIASAMQFYDDERESGGDFDRGIHAGLSRILVSPWFLFRVESESADVPAGATHPVTDIELASRLSFFLWSSIPDDELLDLAEQGRLRDPGVLDTQVRRMIADPRADALVNNFTGQWLQLRNLEQRVKPDLLLFPNFDDNLRQAFRQETELLFGHVLRENRPVHELMTANYTFVNERLARHYGIPGVYGTRFRRVEVKDPNRWGLFGHGSILALTSAQSRTSPIIRGKFIVSQFWDNPPPAPPPNVPALEESAPNGRPSTVREQLELHRANPTCAACHTKIDPVGFALENFDAVGQWRDETREGLPIDSAGVLADGTPVDGPVQLREALLARPETFAGTVTRNLLIYALGRGLEPADMPVVRSVLRNVAEENYGLESIIVNIVESFPFQMGRNKPAQGETVTVAQTRE